MKKISFTNARTIEYEDENSIFAIEPFDARIGTYRYTDPETEDAYHKRRDVRYTDEEAAFIARMHPPITRKTEQYVISFWRLKDTTSDTVVIPGYFENDSDTSKNIIAAVYGGGPVSPLGMDLALNIRHVVIEEGVRFLPSWYFLPCSNLQSIVLPETIESIGHDCFAGLEKLEDIELPDQIQIINNGTFGLCYNLETVQLPQSLKAIARGAFVRTGLKAVVIPDQTEIIAQRAFAECKNLKQVILPDSLYYIADDAFEGCPEDICFLVPRFSYAERWADERWFTYRFID